MVRSVGLIFPGHGPQGGLQERSVYNYCMEIAIADEKILLFTDQIPFDDAKAKAWEKKASAFGTLNQVTSFLSRPKDDDFELTYSEHRYQPFWHVAAKARYVYDRQSSYQVPASAKEVVSVTYQSSTFEITNGHIHIPA